VRGGGLESFAAGSEAPQSAPNAGNPDVGAPPVAGVRDPSPPPADQSGTNPRAGLVASLTQAIAAATVAGDLVAARIAADALVRLLGANAPPDGGEIVDLAERRKG
jgi:hypothetical protein